MSHKARIRSGYVYVINVVQLSIQIEINRKQLIYIYAIDINETYFKCLVKLSFKYPHNDRSKSL